MADCTSHEDIYPTAYSPILWQNPDQNVTLIDIPYSIAKAQESHDAQSFRHLVSSSPPLAPFPSNEPKAASAQAKLKRSFPDADVHSKYRTLVEQAIEEVHNVYEGQWCLPRPFVEEAPRKAKKRRLDFPENGTSSTPHITDGLLDDILLSIAHGAHGAHDKFRKDALRLIPTPSHPARPLSQSGSKDNFPSNFLSSNYKHTVQLKIQPPSGTDTFHFFMPPEASFCIGDCADARPFHDAIRHQARQMNTRRQFDFILLDPPWPNRSVKRTHKTPGSTYSTSPNLWEIRGLILDMNLNIVMADECLVGIWITNKPAVRELILDEDGIFACWGVEPVEEWLWLKTTALGEPLTPLDGVWRKPYEVLLLGRKRKMGAGAHDSTRSFHEPGRNVKRRVLIGVPDLHSRKPCLKELVGPLMPDRENYRALEVFGRHLVAGWWSWGDQCIKFNWEGFWRTQDVTAEHSMPSEKV